MIFDRDKFKLRKIRAIIEEGDKNGISPNEYLLQIKELFPEEVRTVYVEEEKKNSEERLAYFKMRRKIIKEESQLKSKKEKNINKINKSKQRTKIFCFHCKKTIIVNPKLNEVLIEQKRGRDHKNIKIINKCSYCNNKIVASGGILRH